MSVTADLLQGEELAYLGTEPAREAQTAPLPEELHPRVREALAAQGIGELYTAPPFRTTRFSATRPRPGMPQRVAST